MVAVTLAPYARELRGQKQALFFAIGMLAFASLASLPRIRLETTLLDSFEAAGALLVGWFCLLYWQNLQGRRDLAMKINLVPAHYVQASVQLSIYVYWSWYWQWISHTAPLIVAQLIFAYLFDALLSWTRNKPWRIGLGPFPITFSTNLFLCFRDEWFYYQFVVIALAFLAKEFITWERDGRKTHIFNPSAFPLFVFSIALLATGTTDITWAQDIAVKLNNPPSIYLCIFAVGLVVQALFQVTLVTLAAAMALLFCNLVYTGFTGTYWFLDAGIPIAVFLGMHLLVTDPATSPHNNSGRFLFGFLYGFSVFLIYGVLEYFGEPSYFDKLLCVPVLNLMVVFLERTGRTTAGFGQLLSINPLKSVLPRSAAAQNWLAMSVWVILFTLMYRAHMVGPEHPGGQTDFWSQACDEGRPGGCASLQRILRDRCQGGSVADCLASVDQLTTGESECTPERLLGLSMACEFGANQACSLVSRLLSTDNVALLDDRCDDGEGAFCYALGASYLRGIGVQSDPASARDYFSQACQLRFALGCSLMGDLHNYGVAVAADTDVARDYYHRACMLAFAPACLRLEEMYRARAASSNVAVGLDFATAGQADWYRREACAIGRLDVCDR